MPLQVDCSVILQGICLINCCFSLNIDLRLVVLVFPSSPLQLLIQTLQKTRFRNGNQFFFQLCHCRLIVWIDYRESVSSIVVSRRILILFWWFQVPIAVVNLPCLGRRKSDVCLWKRDNIISSVLI